MTEPVSNPAQPSPTPLRSLDERLFMLAIILGLLVIGAVTGLSVWRDHRRAAAESAAYTSGPGQRRLVDFNLLDRTGRPVGRADLSNRFLVVNFVFSACSLSCLQANYRMAEVREKIADQPDTLLVSLTVDPDTDTPHVLSGFASRFTSDTNRWLFLTGERSVLYPLLEKSFLGPPEIALSGVIPGAFPHTDKIVLVDRQGRLRGSFNGLKLGVAAEIDQALSDLRREPAGG